MAVGVFALTSVLIFAVAFLIQDKSLKAAWHKTPAEKEIKLGGGNSITISQSCTVEWQVGIKF